ncbi:hypothetical protein HW555_010425 [Spodoptera exigua]|uniref:Uncharacterized protein n=1 Tax=Spodoptera exigua TaxID=7107 RepID=A0A835GB59_SPOEX|nr:hypothetical protein HW555_010425 [Spodoptera exigua]
MHVRCISSAARRGHEWGLDVCNRFLVWRESTAGGGEDPCSAALGGLRAAAADTRPAFHGQSVCEIMPLNR